MLLKTLVAQALYLSEEFCLQLFESWRNELDNFGFLFLGVGGPLFKTADQSRGKLVGLGVLRS